MAVWFNGMNAAETVALTLAMRDSGDVLAWPGIGKPVGDKHSTGGVGDNVSLMLAPIAAACGIAVPMISGRGLGHTGGTLDKLEAIPGYDAFPTPERFRQVVETVGCAIVGQTAEIAPADKRLYAIRDVTATVDSIPLITASILSKKLAAGLQSLVMDVKTGNGAFMQSLADAEILARSIADVANGAGVRTTAVITDMSEPLADCAGNAIEIAHAMEFLEGGKVGSRIHDVVLTFAAQMLVNAGIERSYADGRARANDALASGRAWELFGRMVFEMGGPIDFVARWRQHLPQAPVTIPVLAPRSGYISSFSTRELGLAVIGLGGGRTRPDDLIDHRVGFNCILPKGTYVQTGYTIAIAHAANQNAAEQAAADFVNCVEISESQIDVSPVIVKLIN
jgi:thymidine phosphorylase